MKKTGLLIKTWNVIQDVHAAAKKLQTDDFLEFCYWMCYKSSSDNYLYIINHGLPHCKRSSIVY